MLVFKKRREETAKADQSYHCFVSGNHKCLEKSVLSVYMIGQNYVIGPFLVVRRAGHIVVTSLIDILQGKEK